MPGHPRRIVTAAQTTAVAVLAVAFVAGGLAVIKAQPEASKISYTNAYKNWHARHTQEPFKGCVNLYVVHVMDQELLLCQSKG